MMKVIVTELGGREYIVDTPHGYLHAVTDGSSKVVSLDIENRDLSSPPPPPPGPQPQGCRSCGILAKIKQLATGTVKFTLSSLGTYAADKKAITTRWAICQACKRNDHGICGECGCILALKVRLRSEKCPLSKW